MKTQMDYFYCDKKGHQKFDCLYFLKHLEQMKELKAKRMEVTKASPQENMIDIDGKVEPSIVIPMVSSNSTIEDQYFLVALTM